MLLIPNSERVPRSASLIAAAGRGHLAAGKSIVERPNPRAGQKRDSAYIETMVELRKKFGFREYHVVGLRRGEWPNQWIWEIFHRGRPLRTRVWGGYFKSYEAAVRAGRPALDALINGPQKGEDVQNASAIPPTSPSSSSR